MPGPGGSYYQTYRLPSGEEVTFTEAQLNGPGFQLPAGATQVGGNTPMSGYAAEQSGGDFGLQGLLPSDPGEAIENLGKGVVAGAGEITGAGPTARANEKAASAMRALAGEQAGKYSSIADKTIAETAKAQALGESFSEDLAKTPSYQEGVFRQGAADIEAANRRAVNLASQGAGRAGTEADRLSALAGGPGYTERLAAQREGGGLDQSAKFALEEGNRDIANQQAALGITRSGSTGEAQYRLGRGVQADMGRRNEQLFASADAQKRANQLAALTGAGTSEDIISGRQEFATGTELKGADLRSQFAEGADAGKAKRYGQAFDLLYTPEAANAAARLTTGLAGEQNATNLQLGALGGDVAAAQARAGVVPDLINMGAQIYGASSGNPTAALAGQKKKKKTRNYYGDDTMEPDF